MFKEIKNPCQIYLSYYILTIIIFYLNKTLWPQQTHRIESRKWEAEWGFGELKIGGERVETLLWCVGFWSWGQSVLLWKGREEKRERDNVGRLGDRSEHLICNWFLWDPASDIWWVFELKNPLRYFTQTTHQSELKEIGSIFE